MSEEEERLAIASLTREEEFLLISAVRVLGDQEGPYCEAQNLKFFRAKYLIHCLAKAGPRLTPVSALQAWSIIEKLSR